jgi:hypothetical protein
MTSRTTIVGILALALTPVSADAGITISPFAESAPGTGALSGFDIFRIYARLDPSGPESGATGIQSIDMTVDTPNLNMRFKFSDFDLDGVNDADILGKTSTTPTTNTSSVGTFIRVGGPASFNLVTVVPAGPNSGTNGTDPSANYAAVKQFRVAGFNATPDGSAIGGNGGKGALIAVVVIPHAADEFSATVLINLAADKGVAYTFFEPLTPEPTSSGLLLLSAMGLQARRRRRTKPDEFDAVHS